MIEFRRFPRLRVGALALTLVAVAAAAALAQTPFWQPQQPAPQPQTPQTPDRALPQSTVPGRRPAPPQATAATPAPAPVNNTVIARIEGKALTQADFDRIAIPYFARMRAQFGTGFEGDVVKIANHNVLDELLRRELLRIEAKRQGIEPTPADIDSVLMRDPYFWPEGKFDAAKFNVYKTSPQSNYVQMLPELKELAAMDVMDRRLRARMTPTPAGVREEWAKRNDQVKFHSFAVLQRDISLDPESTPSEWQAYYSAHSDQFVRRTRIRLRYVRLPLPAEGDSTRPAEEKKAMAEAKAVLDSIQKKTLPDTSARLLDSGMFEPLGGPPPTIGFDPVLQSEIGRADSVASVHTVGPLATRDAVIAGVITEREPKHLPPYNEVVGDVRRQADVEKRRTAADDDRRTLYTEHPERFVTTRFTTSRLTLADAAIQTRPPTKEETDRWYAQNGRRYLNIRDTTRALPPLVDSVRTKIRPSVMHDLRPKQIDEVTAKMAEALRTSKDLRAAARASGAVAETLTLVKGVTNDSLFMNPMVETYYREAASKIGTVQGPEVFSGRYVVWRVDRADTAFVPPYEVIRNQVDVAFREQQRTKDDAEARTYYDAHKTKYKTPTRYGLDYVRLRVPPPDSVKVTEAEQRAYYDAHKDRYRQEEQVHARHLLIMARNVDAADEAKARTRADSLLKAAKGGADFEDLCRRFSQEPGAATTAGDLGWFGRGRMVREFEEAAFALPVGQLSEVVKTQFGFHIIRVEEHKAAGIRPYDEAKAEIHTEMAQSRGDSTTRRAALALRRKLAAGGDMATLTKPYGGVQEAAPIAANETVPELGFVQGMSADLPGMVAGKWAATPYRSGDQYVLVRLRSKRPPGPATFDDARTQALDDSKTEKKVALLTKKVSSIRTDLAAGVPPDTVAAPWGGLREATPTTANAVFVPTLGFGPHIMPKILKLKSGQMSDSLSTPLGVMWVRFDQRVPADAAKYKSQKDQVQQEMVINGMNEWLEAEKKTVKIEVLRADLREPKPGPYKTVTIGG